MHIGLACNQAPPFQLAGPGLTIEALTWRTATPLGFPVVPEV